MNLRSLFKKPAPINPARELALIGAQKRKAADRETYVKLHDEMRAKLGMKPIEWGEQ